MKRQVELVQFLCTIVFVQRQTRGLRSKVQNYLVNLTKVLKLIEFGFAYFLFLQKPAEKAIKMRPCLPFRTLDVELDLR